MALANLYGRFHGECEWLISEINKTLDIANVSSHDAAQERVYTRAQEMVIVRTIDSWGRFCRGIIIQSSFSTPRTLSGILVPNAPGIRSEGDALNRISKLYRSRPGREPPWHVPGQAIRAAKELNINNLLTVGAALGSTPNPIDDLRAIWNCMVHRSPRNFHRASTIISGYGHRGLEIHDFIALPVFPGITMFEKWILTIRSIARASIQ